MTTKLQNSISKHKKDKSIDGVVIGVLVGMAHTGEPLVIFPANQQETAVKAKATTPLTVQDIGKEVALLFEGGRAEKPMIIGKIQQAENFKTSRSLSDDDSKNVVIDGGHITLSGKESITLKCGRSSITLTKSGKILIRGGYLLSRSSGANRIKGGSVQIN